MRNFHPVKRPSLSNLAVFEAVARLGSFKSAAAELGRTPTAVSHAVRSLEAELGARLLIRRHGSLVLSADATRLARAVRYGLQSIDDGLSPFTAGAETVTVSATPAFGSLWLAPRLTELHRQSPDLDVRVASSVTLSPLDGSDGVDLAVRYSDALGGAPTCAEQFQAFAHPSLVSSQRDLRGVRLFETRWVQPIGQAPSWHDWAAEAALKIDADQIMTFDDEQHAVQAAMAGQGLVLTSSVLASALTAQGVLDVLRPDVRLPGRGYRVLERAERAGNRSVRIVSEWLCGQLQLPYN